MTYNLSISARAGLIKPSATLAVAGRAAELRAQGHRVLNFSAGEPDFRPPAAVIEQLVRYLHREPVIYAPVAGLPELREAVATTLSEVHGTGFRSNQVLVSCGAKHSLVNLFLAALSPGDEVVIPAPYWVSYPDMVTLAEGCPVLATTHLSDSYRLTPGELERVLTPRTKFVLINSPSNPTGVGYRPEDLRALGEVLVRKAPQAWIVVDDIYRQLVYDGYEHASAISALSGITDQVIVVDGVSKAYAMTGFRIGFLAGPPALVSAASTIQGQMTSGAATPSQKAAFTALTDPSCRSDVETMRAAFERRRNLMLRGISAVPGLRALRPDGAFYLFVDVTSHCGRGGRFANDVELATWLLEERLIAAVPGTEFGAPGHLRLSYATDEESIRDGTGRMLQAFSSLPTAA